MRGMFGNFSSPSLFRGQSSKDIDNHNHVARASLLQDDDMTPLSRPSSSQRLTKPRTNTNSTSAAMNRRDSSSIRSIPSKPPSRGIIGNTNESERDLVAEGPLPLAHSSSVLNSEQDGSSLGSSPAINPSLASRSASVPATGYDPMNRHSIAGDGSDLDINAAIALLQQLRKNASPEDLIALHKALLPSRTSEHEVADVISEGSKSDEAFSPLIRRSSLLPAGVATRTPSLENTKRRPSGRALQYDRRRSGPYMPRQQSGTWEQFAAGGFDALEPGARAFRPRSGAATPSDIQIPHTGNYQLGSLRVINGAASPEPRSVVSDAGQHVAFRDPSPHLPRQPDSGMVDCSMAESQPFVDPYVTTSRSERHNDQDNTSPGHNMTRKVSTNLDSAAGNPRTTPEHTASKGDSQYRCRITYANHADIHAVEANDENSVLADQMPAAAIDEQVPAPVSVSPVLPSELAPAAKTPAKPESSIETPLFQRRQSMPVTSRDASDVVSVSTAVTAANASVKTTPKQHNKLRKARPQSQQHCSVQSLPATLAQSATEDPRYQQSSPATTAQSSLESREHEHVPEVPDNVRVNFSRRLDHRPGMSHLDHTFTSVEETARKHSKDDAADATVCHNGEDQSRGRARDQRIASETPKAEKRKSFLGHLRSRSRSKSRHRSPTVAVEHEPMPCVSNLESMAPSLGHSPYDIATPQRRSLDSSGPPSHLPDSNPTFTSTKATSYAHQSASAVPKPFTSMDDETAALYARSKSRDIAEQHASERRARSSSRSRRSVTDSVPGSALPRLASSIPTVLEHQQVPEQVRPFRVGTIKFEGGEAQGRMSPIMVDMRRPKTHRQPMSIVAASKPSILATTAPPPMQTSQPVRARPGRQLDQIVPDAPASKIRDSVHSGFESPAMLEESKPNGEYAAPVSRSEHSRRGSKPQASQQSPAIVVSRYVTPTSAEHELRTGNVPDKDLHAFIPTANPTDHRPAKEDVDRTDSAISYKTVASYKSYASTSSRGSSGSYVPYRPMHSASMSYQNAGPERHSRSRSCAAGPTRSNTAPEYDRYSGGLGYGWERGNGFGGSAGTRQGSDQAAKRRSVHLSESWGVDLSDVPVFLTRA